MMPTLSQLQCESILEIERELERIGNSIRSQATARPSQEDKMPITPMSREAILERMRGKEFLAADMPLDSLNEEKRTVDVVFFTGIDIPRVDWWTGDQYILRFDPKGADLSLLNNGAPVLDNHSSWDGSASQKGKVEKAWKDDGEYKATLRFSKRKSVDELWADIQDRIITKFSMGVELLELEKTSEEKDGKRVTTHLAKKWRPFELSIAPIPADFGTTTLAAEERGQAGGASAHKENTMPASTPGEGARIDESTALTAQSVLEDQLKNAREAARAVELARASYILEVQKTCRLPIAFADKHIRGGSSKEVFNEAVIAEQARLAAQYPETSNSGRAMPQISMLRDEADTRRTLMGVAVLGMMDTKQRAHDQSNPFIGLSIMQIAEESARLQHSLRGIPSKSEVVKLSMQNTADFAYVLENSARKLLQARYEYAAPTYRLWTKASTTPDFKTMSRPRLGETPQFLNVPEGAQITIGTMAESKETYALATYGRGVSFTRQMLINDDLGAFNDMIGAFGIQAARLENKTVYSILTTNANMSDAIALFFATHYNLGIGVIANAALDAMFTAMGTQKGIDATTILNLTPRFLIVPKAKEATARAAVMTIGPNVKASDQNWFAGRLEVVPDGELDASSTVMWYGAADPGLASGIEYAHLEGAEGPQFIRKDNEQGILGIQFYAYVDFAAKALDWRPLYKSSGA